MTIDDSNLKKINLDLLKILPIFSSYHIYENISHFVKSIQHLLETVLFKENYLHYNQISDPIFFEKLENFLPIISHSEIQPPPSYFSISCLSLKDFTDGIERFIPDMISRWLIPGKQITINGNQSLGFRFKNFSNKTYYLSESFIAIENEIDYKFISKNIDSFINELRINILSVYHARRISSGTNLSPEEKNTIIKKNISQLINKSHQEYKSSVFDQMHNFLVKLTHEKKISQIHQNIHYLMNKRPKTFDYDIFDSVHNDILLFRNKFSASRDSRHVSRVISFLYLFKKNLKQEILKNPNERYIYFKLMKTRPHKDSIVLGLLICINFINENEHFEKHHLVECIHSCIDNIHPINGSCIIDRRDDKFRSFYIEIEKINNSNFSFEDVKTLKKRLPKILKQRITNIVHPIFMPRNEEEVLRNIIILSKQLKYVNDIPQVIISYEKQSAEQLSFIVILLRLLKQKSKPIKQLFASSNTILKFSNEEVKNVGSLKKKYFKEANIFKLSLKKGSFFRKDYSLDLQKAREHVALELAKTIGDFRDYNGGMILKQRQALSYIKQSLKGISKENEFLLENFFYSLKPIVRQSTLGTTPIKNLFSLLLKLIDNDFEKKKTIYEIKKLQKSIVIIVLTNNQNIKENFQDFNLSLKSNEFSFSELEIRDFFSFGYILNTHSLEKLQKIESFINKTISQG